MVLVLVVGWVARDTRAGLVAFVILFVALAEVGVAAVAATYSFSPTAKGGPGGMGSQGMGHSGPETRGLCSLAFVTDGAQLGRDMSRRIF